MNLIGACAMLAVVAVAAMAGPIGWLLLAGGLVALWKNNQPK